MKNKKLVLIFSISFLLVGGFLMGAYIYTHTEKEGYVPPVLYVRVLDSQGNPVKNAMCYADIETEEELIEDRQLQNIGVFQELECYGRTKCPREDYLGYYKLNITDTSIKEWKFLFFKFWRLNSTIKGDFEIKVVCRTDTAVSYYIFNKTNFPCSPIPLTGDYIAPDFYCSSDNKKIKEHAYTMKEEYFDEYDLKAINFLKENYQNKTILANNKLNIVMDDCNPYKQYSCGLKPVGIIQDKKGYGDPYVFNLFSVSECDLRRKIVEWYNIDLILSRFELEPCDFMRGIYSDKDYIYEIIK